MSSNQLRSPLISEDGSQDVMVVVQCAPTPQLHTLPAAPAASGVIKSFASSAMDKSDKVCDAISYKSLPQDQATSSQKLMKQWRKQTALMWVWLLSSLLVVLFVPLIMAPGALLLASVTASALGVISVIMHSLAGKLTESGTFSVDDQIDLAAACATAAACIDLLALAMAVVWVWADAHSVVAALGASEMTAVLMFACNCWQHGVASVAVMQSVGNIE